jgi:biotin operon repressor
MNLNSDLNQLSFILKFKNILQREIHKIYKTKKLIDDVWGFVKKLEVTGCKINSDDTSEVQLIIDDFVFSIVETVETLKNHKENPKEGIVILIDESDTASKDLNLGVFLKNLSETLVSENCNNVLFVLTGLPTVTDVLRNSHESSLRLFEEITLKPLSFEDVKYVVRKAIKEINEKNPENVISVTEEGFKNFHELSEGYPHFLQQLGFSTISNLSSNQIDKDIVFDSMFNPGGALELIGKRYYVDLFYNKINSDLYRQILSIMAENWNTWISKEEIRKNFSGSGTNLNNGIKALRDRNIILTRRGVRGQYRLQWLSFAFWIKIHKNKMK